MCNKTYQLESIRVLVVTVYPIYISEQCWFLQISTSSIERSFPLVNSCLPWLRIESQPIKGCFCRGVQLDVYACRASAVLLSFGFNVLLILVSFDPFLFQVCNFIINLAARISFLAASWYVVAILWNRRNSRHKRLGL